MAAGTGKGGRPSALFSPEEGLRFLQDLGNQWRNAVTSMATGLTGDDGGQLLEPLTRFGAHLAELSTMWVTPVQELLKEQQDFLQVMTAWAVQQRELADRLAKMAETNQQITDQLTSLLQPLLDQTQKVATRARGAAKK